MQAEQLEIELFFCFFIGILIYSIVDLSEYLEVLTIMQWILHNTFKETIKSKPFALKQF